MDFHAINLLGYYTANFIPIFLVFLWFWGALALTIFSSILLFCGIDILDSNNKNKKGQ